MIKWGIIGVGNVCEKKSGPAFQNIEGSTLVAVMRRTGDLAKDFAERHGVPKWYDDAEKLILDPDINAIYIATPPDSHAYYTALAAAAGKPVYVEKPMACTHQECLDMITACEKAGVQLFVAYYRRTLPNYLKIKALIDEGAIGDVRFVDIKIHKSMYLDRVSQSENIENWRTKPEIAGGGYFYDLASHQLDFLDFLFGPIEKAQGIAKNFGNVYPAEDTTLGTFTFENGILGIGSWCFAVSENAQLDKTTIYGSKGTIEFPFFTGFDVTLNIEGKNSKIFKFDIPLSVGVPFHRNPFGSDSIQQPLIQTIVDELNGTGKCPSTGVSAARTNAVMAQICQRVDV